MHRVSLRYDHFQQFRQYKLEMFARFFRSKEVCSKYLHGQPKVSNFSLCRIDTDESVLLTIRVVVPCHRCHRDLGRKRGWLSSKYDDEISRLFGSPIRVSVSFKRGGADLKEPSYNFF